MSRGPARDVLLFKRCRNPLPGVQARLAGFLLGEISSQAELMAPDKEERGREEWREVESELRGGGKRRRGAKGCMGGSLVRMYLCSG